MYQMEHLQGSYLLQQQHINVKSHCCLQTFWFYVPLHCHFTRKIHFDAPYIRRLQNTFQQEFLITYTVINNKRIFKTIPFEISLKTITWI